MYTYYSIYRRIFTQYLSELERLEEKIGIKKSAFRTTQERFVFSALKLFFVGIQNGIKLTRFLFLPRK